MLENCSSRWANVGHCCTATGINAPRGEFDYCFHDHVHILFVLSHMDDGKHEGNMIYCRFLTSVSHYSNAGSNMHRNITMHQQRREGRRLQACESTVVTALLKSMGDAGTNTLKPNMSTSYDWSPNSDFFIYTMFISRFHSGKAPVRDVIAISSVTFGRSPVHHFEREISGKAALWSVFSHFLDAFLHQKSNVMDKWDFSVFDMDLHSSSLVVY